MPTKLDQYTMISRESPAFITLYKDAFSPRAKGAELRPFRSLDELAAWLGKPPKKQQEKRRVPLFARSAVDGPRRKKRNLQMPLIVVMDVDKSPVSIADCSARLDIMGVAHFAHTTWSHGSGRRHSYRVFVDYLARSWGELEMITRQLFALVGVEATPESWDSGWFFVPAIHPRRARAYRTASSAGPSTWTPAWRPPPEKPRPALRATEEIEVDVDELRLALEAIPNEDLHYDEWLRVGMAIESTGLEEGLQIWHEWSAKSPKHDPEECDRRWRTFETHEGGVTARTIFRLARAEGWSANRSSPREDFAGIDDGLDDEPAEIVTTEELPTVALVRAGRRGPLLETGHGGAVLRNVGNAVRCLAAMDLRLAHDEFADRAMMLGAGYEAVRARFPSVTRHVDDDALHALLWMIWEGANESLSGVEFSMDAIFRGVKTLSLNQSFNPVVAWLRGLKWDGQERLDTWLVDHCGADARPLISAAGRILLTGAVARAMAPGIKFDLMVVLEGSQGAGKSSLVALLGGEYALEGLPTSELRDKDVVTAMQGKWFVELDELDVARKADAQSLKSFLTRTIDRIRKPYEKFTRDFPRRCVFIGTTNDSSYLKDATGNRRFLPAKVGTIDLVGVERDRDQLFAEATTVWRADPRWQALVLPERLWEDAALEAEERRLIDPWEDAIEEFTRRDPRSILKATEVLEDGLLKPTSQQRNDDYRRVKAAMTRIGWEYGRFRRRREGQVRGDGELVRGFKRPSALE